MTPKQETFKHILRVRHYIYQFVKAVRNRADDHDASKLESPEAEMFEDVTKQLKGTTYGSPEYNAVLKGMLGQALQHHYDHNRHHPEFHKNGVDDMNLVDIVEMFCDWRAATERHKDGNIFKSIEINTERFKMSEQLASIFKNTAKLFDNPEGILDEKDKKEIRSS